MTAGPRDSSRPALIQMARAHRLAGKVSEAVGVLVPVLQASPGDGDAHHEMGLALRAGGAPSAVKHLETAVRLAPERSDRLADLGEARMAFGEATQGLAAFRAALALAPTDADRLLQLAKGLAATRDLASADRWIGRALGLRRSFGEALTIRGVQMMEQGRAAEAVEAFNRSIRDDPDYTNAYIALAGVLELLGAPKAEVMKPGLVAARRLPDRRDVVTPVMQYLRDIGEEAESVRFSSRVIDAEMASAENDPFGRHGFRILFPDDLVTRIGELAHQLELHVKMKQLGWIAPCVSILLAPRERVVNQCILDYWRRYITVVDDPELIKKLDPLKDRVSFNPVYIRLPDGRAMSKNRVYHAVQEEWQRRGRGPLLSLDRRHAERGWSTLRRLGVPDGAWFACVHVRESGYLKEAETSTEAARNADIQAFVPAMEAITRRGGWVVRLGDASMTPLSPMPQVVDYALSAEKSDWMDVFLAAACRFMLATTSGMMVVGLNFDTPVAATNFFPPGETTSSSRNLFTPKLIRERGSGRLLSFDESLSMPLALTYDARRLDDLGLEAIDTDAVDILSLTEEMLEKVEGRAAYTSEDEALQRRWTTLLSAYATGDPGSRIGRGFLRRHRDLFRSW